MSDVFSDELQAQLEREKLMAVLMIQRLEDAVPLAQALYRGGIRLMELTLRTPVALDALKAIRKKVPEMVAGIGTVLTPSQVDEVVDAGGAFGVSPGVNLSVLNAAKKAGLSFAPGIATPTDIETSLEQGCRLMKFFPCAPMGGIPYLKSIMAPYQHLGLKMIPLGGVNPGNLREFLSLDCVAAVGGSWLAPADVVSSGDWGQIEKIASEAVEIIKNS